MNKSQKPDREKVVPVREKGLRSAKGGVEACVGARILTAEPGL